MVINIDSSVKDTLAALDALKEAKGNIVFVSSVAAFKPAESGFAYCMSKSSMSMFAKCMAVDRALHIRVVSPGPVETAIFERSFGFNVETVRTMLAGTTLADRVGKSEEIANAVYFLASDERSFITGHEMVIDGGYMISYMLCE